MLQFELGHLFLLSLNLFWRKHIFIEWRRLLVMLFRKCIFVRSPYQLFSTCCVHPRLESVFYGYGVHEQTFHLRWNHGLLLYNFVGYLVTSLGRRGSRGWSWAWVFRFIWSQTNSCSLHLDHDLQVLGLMVHFSDAVELLDIFIRPVPAQCLAGPWGTPHWQFLVWRSWWDCCLEEFILILFAIDTGQSCRSLYSSTVLLRVDSVARAFFCLSQLLLFGENCRGFNVLLTWLTRKWGPDHEIVRASELLNAWGAARTAD